MKTLRSADDREYQGWTYDRNCVNLDDERGEEQGQDKNDRASHDGGKTQRGLPEPKEKTISEMSFVDARSNSPCLHFPV